MADVIAVRATITKIFEGYSLTLVMNESGRSRLLLDERAASVFEAEAVAASFTSLHRIPRHAVEVLYR
jgi:hypothetical protein